MGSYKTYGPSFNLALVTQCCGETKSKRVDFGAQLDLASPRRLS
jgi:hypothetical protein